MTHDIARPPVFFDVQGLQNRWSAERGIGRYVFELLQAIDLLDRKRITHLVLNPDLPIWESLDRFVGDGRLVFSDRLERQDVGVLHVPSPLEPVSLERLWPPQLRALPLVVTVHDLIPDVFRSDYLNDTRSRRVYRTRLELVRRADQVLVPSHATAEDVERRLGIDSRRVVVAPEGVSDRFQPGDRATALAEVRRAFPRIRRDFVLYTGGVDPRKNVAHLLAGYGRLDDELRNTHQLVIVSGLPLTERHKLEQRARELRIEENVMFTGFVSDELLVRLYQAARVFALPSLYEGYGLPIVEALACNTPVLAARAPGTAELLDPGAMFDPYDVDSLAAALASALVDDDAIERLRNAGRMRRPDWKDAAERTIAAYDDVARRKHPPAKRRPYLAFAAPLPPGQLATAHYHFDLLTELRELCDIDVFVDEEVDVPAGVGKKQLGLFEAADRIRGGYAGVLCCLAATPGHAAPLTLLRRRPAVVLAHDVRLTGLRPASRARKAGVDGSSFAQAVRAMYGSRLATALHPDDADEALRDPARFGVLLAREVIAHSGLFLVHSAYDAELARLDANPWDQAKIGAVPFGFRGNDLSGLRQEGRPLVATYGTLESELRVERFIDAVAAMRSDGTAVQAAILVRGASAGDRRRWLEKARMLNPDIQLDVVLDPNQATLDEWLRRTTIAVQVDRWPSGELWAATAGCLAAGVPTIVSASGYSRSELPESAAVRVERDVTGSNLARVLEELLRDERRRSELGDAASAHARTSSVSFAAAAILERIVEPHPVQSAPAVLNGDGLHSRPGETSANLSSFASEHVLE